VFNGWAATFKDIADVLAIEPPGRGARFGEKLVDNLEGLARQLCDEIASELFEPTMFLGYSNGALIAYAVALELRRRGLSLPAGLILAANSAPHVTKPTKLHSLPHEALLAKLLEMGGMSEEEIASKEFVDLFVPILRADFALGETHNINGQEPLDCSLVTLSGSRDSEALPHEVSQWARYVCGNTSSYVLDGGHFFIRTHRAQVFSLVRTALEECLSLHEWGG
jgi:medium-chain acyl-[acyl-carrier-protein] hydrolase